MNFLAFSRRELSHSPAQLLLFVSCVALSLLSIVSLGAFESSVRSSLQQDAKAVNGGDIIVSSSRPFSEELNTALARILENPQNSAAHITTFPTIIYSPIHDTSLLASVEAVDDTYPLYGTVALDSGKDIRAVLEPNSAIVEKNILARMGIAGGETLKIGEAEFRVADTLLSTPDGGVDIFSAGQKVLISAQDLEKTQLLGSRSRVSYTAYLKIPQQAQMEMVLSELEAAAGDREQVESFQNARTSAERFLEELLFFLNLISLFTLLLAGIGMMSTLSTYLRGREKTIAIFKTLGMKNREILALYRRFIFFLSLAGTLVGIFGGAVILQFLPQLFADFLPVGFVAELQLLPMLEGIILGIFGSLLFATLPLLQLQEVKPVQVFRKLEVALPTRNPFSLVIAACIGLIFSVFVLLEIGEIRLGFYFLAGSIGLFAFLFEISKLLLQALAKFSAHIRILPLKLAMKGLLRPGNSTALILTSVGTALTILLTIMLLERNIITQFVNTYPEEYPNVFFLDIQKDQQAGVREIIGQEAYFYPIIRGNLESHNGSEITEATQESIGRGNDSVTRTFSLSYGLPLSENEVLLQTLQSGDLFSESYERTGFVQVSILEEFGALLDMEMGDELVFRVQGVEVRAEIVSIRERKEERIEPYFYFIFEEEELKNFPQTLFTTAKVEPQEIPYLQNTLTRAYPNITTIDMTLIIAQTTTLLTKLNGIIRFFTLFSLVAGILLLISSLLSTSLERIREGVFYKLIGLKSAQVRWIALSEFAFLGFFAGSLGVIFAEATVFLITNFVLSISFEIFWVPIGIMIFGLITLIVFIAWIFLIPLLRVRPISYLRASARE